MIKEGNERITITITKEDKILLDDLSELFGTKQYSKVIHLLIAYFFKVANKD